MSTWKYATIDDLLSGGKADNVDISIPKKELEKGIKVESEHSNNPGVQKEIVKDHEVESVQDLSGEPNYYEYLDKMEEQMKADRKGSSIEKTPNVYIPDKFQSKLPQKQQHKKKQDSDNKFEEMLEETKGSKLDITGNFIQDLFKFADTLGIHLSDELSENLLTIYEWEYKYHKIINSQSTNEKRKNFLLSRISQELNPVLLKVRKDLWDVYEKWLNSHALLSPHTWATHRAQDAEYDSEVDNKELFESLFRDYEQYVNSSREEFVREFIEFNYELIHLYIKDYMNEELYNYEIQLEEAQSQKNEELIQELTQRINYLNDEIENPNAYEIQEYISTYYGSLDQFIETIMYSDLQRMTVKVWEDVVFQNWYEHWQEKDIDSVRANNEDIANKLQAAESITDQFKIINIALNGVHVTGQMTDYINNIDSSIDQSFLSELSNMDVSQWDKDLTLLGIH